MCFFSFSGAKIWPAAAGTGELARDLRDPTHIYTLRTLRSDESAGYIALVRTSDRIPSFSVRDTEGDDLRSAGLTMDGDDDFFMTHPTDDFSD